MEIKLLECGACFHPEFIARKKGGLSPRRFPALVVYLNHPILGKILFDTGYSQDFFTATQSFPYSLYRKLTPVELEASAKDQLEEMRIDPSDINYIILSHLHGDHIGGINDFPNAKFILHEKAYQQARNQSGITGLRKGFLTSLLPTDFHDRVWIIQKSDFSPSLLSSNFTSFDLAKDQSLFLIPLPGHSPGQIGLWVNHPDYPYFFISDACWLQENLTHPPHSLARIVTEDHPAFIKTLNSLSTLAKQKPELTLIPSHCSTTLEKIWTEQKGGLSHD